MNIRKILSSLAFSLVFFLIVLFAVFIPFLSVHADDSIPPSDPVPVPQETILIRNDDTVIYQGTIALPSAGTVNINDDASVAHSVNADSVLGILYALDQTSSSFSISDLQYFDSFSSFYLKCLTSDGATQLCSNWQYVVNGSTPATSMDSTILSGGENIGLYFGNPHQVIFDTTNITAGGSFTATAQKYNYIDNTWNALTGVTIGTTQPNPNDAWNPTVITSGSVDADGKATLILANSGTYNVGIYEDFYFPSYTVTATAPVSNGGGSGGIPPPSPAFSLSNALSYLSGNQGSDGSFGGSMLYTDWASIALSAGGVSGSVQTNILNYMTSHNTVSSLLTDNERHSIALLALGQNPYSFNGVDYIDAIVNSFDGTQFGDSSLTNDDIFALIPLASAGYTASDSIITKDISFILGKQQSDGSWEESVDLTAAAVQALSPFNSISGVSSALSNVSSYLQNAQGSDGGWGNVSSSAWASQAMSIFGSSWVKNGKTISDYFAIQQVTDGAVLSLSETLENRIWATSYAILGYNGKPWSLVMHSVAKQIKIEQKISNDNTSKTTEMIHPVDTVAPAATTPIVLTVIPSNTVTITNLKPIITSTDQLKKKIKKEIAKQKIITKPILESITPKTEIKNNILVASAASSPVAGLIPSLNKVVDIVIASILNLFNYIFRF